MNVSLRLAVVELFKEAREDVTAARVGEAGGRPSVQMLYDGAWINLPLEWNTAIRLAELAGRSVQIVDRDGEVLRTYDPSVTA